MNYFVLAMIGTTLLVGIVVYFLSAIFNNGEPSINDALRVSFGTILGFLAGFIVRWFTKNNRPK